MATRQAHLAPLLTTCLTACIEIMSSVTPSVARSSARPAGVADAVNALQKASRTPAKQRPAKVSGVVDTICRYAFDHGLDADNLRAVVQIVSRKTELDQTSVTSLIKNLYPSQRISADVIVTVVGALGQGKGKPSLGTQNGLVQWLTIVHEIIEDPRILSRLYGVLFGMLDMISIRTSLCYLLSCITRRKHVQQFRIQQILELSRGIGNEPALQGLLRIYRDYYPDIILSSSSTNRKSFPPRPEAEWQKRLLSIRDLELATNDHTLEQHGGFRVLRNGPKRSKVSTIPEVHTFRASETSVTLEEIDNADDFVEKLERIEPPGQMLSFLTDPLLQKYVELNPSPITNMRIGLWLSTCLEEEYNSVTSGLETSAQLSDILDGLYRHTQFCKQLHPVVSPFLKAYLPVWDGVTGVDAMLGLLSYTPLQSFQGAYEDYFAPAEKAVAGQTPQAYAKLLHFYSDLLQHWTNPQSAPGPAQDEIVESLVAHVSTLSISLVLSTPAGNNSPLVSSILTFYELLSTSSKPMHVPIIPPPLYLTYLLAQSASATVLSRICGIYANCKRAFNIHPTPISDYYPATTTVTFNSGVLDLYSLVWGSKANRSVAKSPAFFCAPNLSVALNEYLARTEHGHTTTINSGLSHNPLLASMSAAAWKALEKEKTEKQGDFGRDSASGYMGPVTQEALEALERNRSLNIDMIEYKKYVLQWLAERGCSGISSLMYVTHGKLKAR